MHHFLLLRGIVVGFLTAAPAGPAGLLCIQRTLSSGWRAGFLLALGVAVADGIFAMIAAFGLTAMPGFFSGHELLIRIIGGLFLLFVGVRLVRAHTAATLGEEHVADTWRDMGESFFVAITNPLTLPALFVIFAATGLGGEWVHTWQALVITAGVFIGFLLWWLVLSGFIDALREKFTPALVRAINRATGLIIIAFGAAVLLMV